MKPPADIWVWRNCGLLFADRSSADLSKGLFDFQKYSVLPYRNQAEAQLRPLWNVLEGVILNEIIEPRALDSCCSILLASHGDLCLSLLNKAQILMNHASHRCCDISRREAITSSDTDSGLWRNASISWWPQVVPFKVSASWLAGRFPQHSPSFWDVSHYYTHSTCRNRQVFPQKLSLDHRFYIPKWTRPRNRPFYSIWHHAHCEQT